MSGGQLPSAHGPVSQASGLHESVDAATVTALGDGDGALLKAARPVVRVASGLMWALGPWPV